MSKENEQTEEVKPYSQVTLRFANKSPNPNPAYAKNGDSCFDLRAWVTCETPDGQDEDGAYIILKAGRNRLIHTGLYFELPRYTEMQVRPRSGLALKHCISVTNAPGTVDELFRNEVGVILENRGTEDFIIHDGDRIAQAGIYPVFNSRLVDFEQVDEVDTNTDRALGGFGHTGIK